MQTSKQLLAAVSLCTVALLAHASATRLDFGTAESADGSKRITLSEPQADGDNQARVHVEVKLPKGQRCTYEGSIDHQRGLMPKPIPEGAFSLPQDPAARYQRELVLQLPKDSRLSQCRLNFSSAPQGFAIKAAPLDPKAANARNVCNQFCGAKVNLSGHYTFR